MYVYLSYLARLTSPTERFYRTLFMMLQGVHIFPNLPLWGQLFSPRNFVKSSHPSVLNNERSINIIILQMGITLHSPYTAILHLNTSSYSENYYHKSIANLTTFFFTPKNIYLKKLGIKR